MSDEEFDEEEEVFEDEFADQMAEPVPKIASKPVKPRIGRPPASAAPQIKEKIRLPEKEQPTTFSAFHLPEQIGVKNDKTNEIVGQDVYSILAKLMTEVQAIKEAVC